MSALIPYDTGTLEIAVQMAIGTQVTLWDQSSWNYAEWSSELVGGWVDVTCDASEVNLTAGATAPDGVVTAINATTGGISLHGDQYNPWAPPWGDQGQLGPRVPVRLLWRHQGDATFKTFFTGVTDGWPYERSSGTAPVPIIDATGGLANLDLLALDATAAVGQGEALSDRMNRILSQAAWPTGLRAIPTDARKVISTTFGASAWTMLANAADTGLGLMWVKRTGEVAYLPVGQAGGWTPHYFGINLTDTHADSTNVCVVDYTNSDPQVTRNAVTISRAADPLVSGDVPVAATLVDQQSVNQYGPATYSRTDLINADDAWSATVAGAVLLDGAWPVMHPQIADLDIRFDIRVADLLLATEIGDVLLVHDSGQLFQCAVVGWSVDITRKGLTGSLILSDISQWTGGLWDTDLWDRGTWSI